MTFTFICLYDTGIRYTLLLKTLDQKTLTSDIFLRVAGTDFMLHLINNIGSCDPRERDAAKSCVHRAYVPPNRTTFGSMCTVHDRAVMFSTCCIRAILLNPRPLSQCHHHSPHCRTHALLESRPSERQTLKSYCPFGLTYCCPAPHPTSRMTLDRYGRFMPVRSFVRRILKETMVRVAYDDDVYFPFHGTTELLEFYGCIVNGFVSPIKVCVYARLCQCMCASERCSTSRPSFVVQ